MRRFVRPLRLTAAALALTIAVSPVYAATMSEMGTNTVTESAVSEDTKDTSSSLKEDEGELKEDVSADTSKDTSKTEESKETESENTETEGEKEQAPSKAEDDTKETEAEVKETETEASDDTVKESQPAKENSETTHESETTLENEKTDTVLSDEKTPDKAETTTVKEIEAVKIVLPKPVRDGYEFVEWNTRIDGEGESYQAGDEIEVTPMALYAIWREV